MTNYEKRSKYPRGPKIDLKIPFGENLVDLDGDTITLEELVDEPTESYDKFSIIFAPPESFRDRCKALPAGRQARQSSCSVYVLRLIWQQKYT